MEVPFLEINELVLFDEQKHVEQNCQYISKSGYTYNTGK